MNKYIKDLIILIAMTSISFVHEEMHVPLDLLTAIHLSWFEDLLDLVVCYLFHILVMSLLTSYLVYGRCGLKASNIFRNAISLLKYWLPTIILYSCLYNPNSLLPIVLSSFNEVILMTSYIGVQSILLTASIFRKDDGITLMQYVKGFRITKIRLASISIVLLIAAFVHIRDMTYNSYTISQLNNIENILDILPLLMPSRSPTPYIRAALFTCAYLLQWQCAEAHLRLSNVDSIY